MVLRAKDVSPKQLHYSSVKRSKSGKYSLVTYNDEPLRIQLSRSECKYINNDNGRRHFLNISLNSSDAKFFQNFDNIIEESYIDEDDPLEHSRQLVNGSITIRMTTNIATDTDKRENGSSFTPKLYEAGKSPKEIDYNQSNLPIFLENRRLSVIIECIGIWFKKGKVGVTWKVNQMQLVQSKYPNKYAFIDSDEDEDEPDLYPSDSDM